MQLPQARPKRERHRIAQAFAIKVTVTVTGFGQSQPTRASFQLKSPANRDHDKDPMKQIPSDQLESPASECSVLSSSALGAGPVSQSGPAARVRGAATAISVGASESLSLAFYESGCDLNRDFRVPVLWPDSTLANLLVWAAAAGRRAETTRTRSESELSALGELSAGEAPVHGPRRQPPCFGALRRSAQRSAAGMRLRNAASMRVKRVGRALSARPATRALARSPQRQLCAGRKRISRCLSESVRGGGDRRPLQNLSRRMHSVAFRNMPRTWIRKPPKKRT